MKETLKRSRRFARDIYVRSSVRVFGNHIGLKINLLHAAYRLAYRLRWRAMVKTAQPDRKATETTLALKRDGFAKLEPFLPSEQIEALKNKVDDLFDRPDKVVHSLQDGGLLRLKNSLVEVPEVEQFVMHGEVRKIVENYFGGCYSVFSCDLYRTSPAEDARAKEVFPSLLWHFDNCPSSMLKIMIYIRDTTVDTGALTLVDKRTSAACRNGGFWDRQSADRFSARLEEKAVRLEGAAGTALLFSTHYCIHRATLPRQGIRDVAVLQLQPSLAAPQPWTDQSRKTYSHNYGYCINPFSNTPLRIGDE